MTAGKSQITRHAKRVRRYLGLACKERFRGSYLGFFWALFHPLVPLAVNNLVFAHLLSRDPIQHLLFVASGFIPWFFLSQSIQMSNRSLLHHMALLRTQPTAVPALFTAEVLTTLLPLALWLPLLGWFQGQIGFAMVLAVLSLVLGTISISFFLSFVQVFFRDVRFVLPLFLQCGLFLCPILYPASQWPLAQYLPHPAWINPLFLLIEPIQGILTGRGPVHLGASLGLSLGLCALSIGAWANRRQEAILHA